MSWWNASEMAPIPTPKACFMNPTSSFLPLTPLGAFAVSTMVGAAGAAVGAIAVVEAINYRFADGSATSSDSSDRDLSRSLPSAPARPSVGRGSALDQTASAGICLNLRATIPGRPASLA